MISDSTGDAVLIKDSGSEDLVNSDLQGSSSVKQTASTCSLLPKSQSKCFVAAAAVQRFSGSPAAFGPSPLHDLEACS